MPEAPAEFQWCPIDRAPHDVGLHCVWENRWEGVAWCVGPLAAEKGHPHPQGTWMLIETGEVVSTPIAFAAPVDAAPPMPEEEPPSWEDAAEAMSAAQRTLGALIGRIAEAHQMLVTARDRYAAQGRSPAWLHSTIALLSEPLSEFEGRWPGPDQWETLETLRRKHGSTIMFTLRPNAEAPYHAYVLDTSTDTPWEGFSVTGSDAYDVVQTLAEDIETRVLAREEEAAAERLEEAEEAREEEVEAAEEAEEAAEEEGEATE